MKKLMMRPLGLFSGVLCLTLGLLAEGSSRGRSFTSRAMRLHPLQSQSQDDFYLSYLKEVFNKDAKAALLLRHQDERGFLEWVPDGSLISAVPPECLPENFEQKVQKSDLSAAAFGSEMNAYFKKCGRFLNANATGGLLGLVDFAVASYPFLENGRIRPVIFQFQDGRKVKGYIGVKDSKPRPWVIYKCGVFCAAEPNAASLKNFMIHLFDQAPFNVVFVGNRTGTDYIKMNHRFNFGGYFEHQDFLDLSRWLREDSPYSESVSSVHVVAVSLAGSAAFLTEKQLSTNGDHHRHLIQSVTSLCAVSDLKPTVENMYEDSLKGAIFSRLTWHNLRSVKSFLPGVEDLLSGERPKNVEFPRLLGQLATRFMTEESPVAVGRQRADANADTGGSLNEKEKAFWEKSQYSAYTHRATVPLLIWASEDDSVVDFKINTGNLLKVKAQASDPNVGVVGVPKGEHCGFATAYGYPVMASMVRSFILNNSPEFSLEPHRGVIDLDAMSEPMLEGERVISYWWSQSRSEGLVDLNLEIYGADDSLCPEEWAYEGAESCRRIVYMELPQSLFERYGFVKPRNAVEREVLVRELNARAAITVHGRSVVGQPQWPDQIQIRF